MYLGEINLFFVIFFILFISIVLNVTSALHLILTAEFLWITLYIITLNVSIIFDSLNILSLTFFLLVISATEFGIGLIILVMQHLFFRSLSLNNNSKNPIKFANRIVNKVNLNNYKFFNF